MKIGVINVYSSCINSEKMTLWEEIVCTMDTNNSLAWCVVGDFNAVRYPSERKGIDQERVNRLEMERLNAFIGRSQLFEILVVWRTFTWYRPNGTARSLLDIEP